MKLTATNLRSNLYKVLDQVITTGVPVEIERKGKKIKLVPVETRSKLNNLKSHPPTIIGDPEELVHMDWSSYWNYNDDIS